MPSSILQKLRSSANNKFLSVHDIQLERKLRKLYLIEVAETHNFFVTETDILVHNGVFVGLPALSSITGVATSALQAIAVFVGIKKGKENLDKMDADAAAAKAKTDIEANQSEVLEARKPKTKKTPPKKPEDDTITISGGDGKPPKPPKKKKNSAKKKARSIETSDKAGKSDIKKQRSESA